MRDDGHHSSAGSAQIVGGLALVFAAILLVVLDAATPEWQFEATSLGLFLGTGASLLLGGGIVGRMK